MLESNLLQMSAKGRIFRVDTHDGQFQLKFCTFCNRVFTKQNFKASNVTPMFTHITKLLGYCSVHSSHTQSIVYIVILLLIAGIGLDSTSLLLSLILQLL